MSRGFRWRIFYLEKILGRTGRRVTLLSWSISDFNMENLDEGYIVQYIVEVGGLLTTQSLLEYVSIPRTRHPVSDSILRKMFGGAVISKLVPTLMVDECSICLELDGNEAVQLPCHHVFHRRCIEEWVVTNASCPMCRVRLDGS